MKRFLGALASCLVVAAVPAVADDGIKLEGIQFRIVGAKKDDAKKDDKIDKTKLVGRWEAKKLDTELTKLTLGLMSGIWEFKKDGSMRASIKLGKVAANLPGVELSLVGKYELDGNKLTITLALDPEGNIKIQGVEEITYKTTITKLTGMEFQTKNEKGKVCEFKKEELTK
jgi:uncharacterized protein (TIGR03066 family)